MTGLRPGATSRSQPDLTRLSVIGLAIALLVALASAIRLHFGVDFTDEAFYASIPYRFALGDTPYKSDLGIAQNAGLVTLPVVKLWVWLVGSTDGLILALRYTYFAVRIALALLAIRTFWGRAPAIVVLLAAAVTYAFVFYALPALSYNTVAGAAVGVALLLTLRWSETSRVGHAVGAIVAMALAAFSHPALAPVALVHCFAIVALAPTADARRRASKIVGVLAVALCVVVAGIVVAVGTETIIRFATSALEYVGPFPALDRFARLPDRLRHLQAIELLLAACWGTMWWSRALTPLATALLCVAFAILTAFVDNQLAMVWLGAGSLPITYARWRARGDRAPFFVAALSVSAGMSIGMSSTNGILNAAVGSEVAVMLFLIGTHEIIRDRTDSPSSRWLPLTAPLLALVVVTRFAIGQWNDVYRDDAVFRLTVRVTDGPYRGMRTTPTKFAYLDRVQRALRDFSGSNKSLLVFNRFPAAYLMVPIPPALPTTWVQDNRDEWVRLRAAASRRVALAPRPSLVLHVLRLQRTASSADVWDYPDDDPMILAVRALRPKQLFSSTDFALYQIGAASP